MSRTFTQKVDVEFLAEKIWDALKVHEGIKQWEELDDSPKTFVKKVYLNGATYYINHLTPTISKDLSKIKFDTENVYVSCEDDLDHWKQKEGRINGFHTLSNGLTFLGVIAGGDWEAPIFFIIYWDGKKLRGYIPENGNVYSKKHKEAYGNSEPLPDNDDDFDFDQDKLLEDIEKRIVFHD